MAAQEAVIMDQSEIQKLKTTAVKSLFIDTADHNYIVARWAFFHGLNRDFYWNGLHCVEKYMKAALVLNGQCVKEYRHNIGWMYRDLVKTHKEFMPPNYSGPIDSKSSSFFTDEKFCCFVDRLNNYGCPDNRYAYFSYVMHPHDVFYLDALVFSVRRLCVILDQSFCINRDAANGTFRDKLRVDPAFQPYGGYPNLPAVESEARASELREALFRMNPAFLGPEEYRKGKPLGFQASNSVLSWLIDGLSDPEKSSISTEKASVIRWLIENIKFHSNTKSELQRCSREA